MAFVAGILLALAVALFARFSRLDRDRAFYPTVLAVIASYYDLFAVMGGSMHALILELPVTAVFLVAVVAGFRRNLWIVVAALVAHGLFDFIHGSIISNPVVPAWWPMFCLSYDLTAAAWLASLLNRAGVAHASIAEGQDRRTCAPAGRQADARTL